VSDEWVQAKNLVRQQVEIMVNELEELTRRVNNQRAAIDVLQKERDNAVARLNDLPSMRAQFELTQLRAQVHELEQTVDRYSEFMRLKDNAKIKVEGQREHWREKYHDMERVSNIHRDARRIAEEKVRGLEAQNERQAKAFEERGKAILKKDELIRQMSAENGRLIEVIKLGRKGIEGEGRDWELGFDNRRI